MKKHFHIHIKAGGGIFTKIGKDPYADWAFILLLSSLAAVVFIYFSVTLFISVRSGTAELSAQATKPSAGGTLDRTDLSKLIGDFQDKQSRTALFQGGYQGAPDPSGTSTPLR